MRLIVPSPAWLVSIQHWLRLRASSLRTARERLAQDAVALTQINALAAELGLKDATP